jgi:hypothetical protein
MVFLHPALCRKLLGIKSGRCWGCFYATNPGVVAVIVRNVLCWYCYCVSDLVFKLLMRIKTCLRAVIFHFGHHFVEVVLCINYCVKAVILFPAISRILCIRPGPTAVLVRSCLMSRLLLWIRSSVEEVIVPQTSVLRLLFSIKTFVGEAFLHCVKPWTVCTMIYTHTYIYI